jgi:putative membrane protein
MSHLIAQIVVNGITLWIAAYFVPGISFTGGVLDLLILGLIFGIVNWIIKPLVVILTLPLTILTLGLFALIINALMLLLTGALAPNYHVGGFLPALLGSIVVSILSMLINRFVK